MKTLLVVILLLGFYTDVSSDQSSASSSEAGWASESSYGYQDGRGI